MTSKIVVNNIESDSGISSVTFTSDIELGTKNLKGHNLESTGIVTAVSFTGSGANLTNLPAGNLTGTVADARISTLTASKLTGALPAIDGSNLTGVSSQKADGCVTENSQTISNNYTMGTNKSGISAGPITIANNVTVNIPSGSRYVIV